MNAAFLKRIQSDYPDLTFKKGTKFSFRPPETITVGPDEPGDDLLLLHEIGHALIGRFSFSTEVERLKIEREAWEKAREISKRYNIELDENIIQSELDTYRDWLNTKSRCPRCGLIRFQTPNGKFHCPRCEIFVHKKTG